MAPEPPPAGVAFNTRHSHAGVVHTHEGALTESAEVATQALFKFDLAPRTGLTPRPARTTPARLLHPLPLEDGVFAVATPPPRALG